MPIVPSHIIPTNTATKVRVSRHLVAWYLSLVSPRKTSSGGSYYLFLLYLFVYLFVFVLRNHGSTKFLYHTKLNLLWARVVVRTSNMKVSPCRLADYVKRLRQKACSTIIFPHLTNQIIDLWRCRCCWCRHFLNSLLWQCRVGGELKTRKLGMK